MEIMPDWLRQILAAQPFFPFPNEGARSCTAQLGFFRLAHARNATLFVPLTFFLICRHLPFYLTLLSLLLRPISLRGRLCFFSFMFMGSIACVCVWVGGWLSLALWGFSFVVVGWCSSARFGFLLLLYYSFFYFYYFATTANANLTTLEMHHLC